MKKTSLPDRDFPLSELAEIVTPLGGSSLQSRNRLLYLAGIPGLLESYGRGRGAGAKAQRLYPLFEACKAGVLFAIIDAGVKDHDVLRTAAIDLISLRYPPDLSDEEKLAWSKDDSIPKPRPIERAIWAVLNGGNPAFVLSTYQHGDHPPQRRGDVCIYSKESPSLPEGFLTARSCLTVALEPILRPILIKAGVIKAH